MNPTNEHPTQPTSASTRRLPCSGRVVACVESLEFSGRAEPLGAWHRLSPHAAVATAHCVQPWAAHPPAQRADAGTIDIRCPDMLRAAGSCLALGGRLRHGAGRQSGPSRDPAQRRHSLNGRPHGSHGSSAPQRGSGSRANDGAPGADRTGSTASLAGRRAAVAAGPGRGHRLAAPSAVSGAPWRDAVASLGGGTLQPPYTPAARCARSHRTIRNQHEARNPDQRRPAGGVPDRHP